MLPAAFLARIIGIVAKYDPLCRFLRDSGEQHLDVGIDAIANMVDGGLPPSAYDLARRMWWSNTSDDRHVQAATGWLAAGYVVDDVDYTQRRVHFRRGSAESRAGDNRS